MNLYVLFFNSINSSRWKTFTVFADQSLIVNEIACAMGFGYTRLMSQPQRFSSELLCLPQKFSTSSNFQCKVILYHMNAKFMAT